MEESTPKQEDNMAPAQIRWDEDERDEFSNGLV